MTTDIATLPASQRFDLRKAVVDDVLDRVEKSLQVELSSEGSVRKRRTINVGTDRGTWVRIECRGLEKLDGQGWGLEAAEALPSEVPRPTWLAGVSWLDMARRVMWRADETTVVAELPVGDASSARSLSDEWWTQLDDALDSLATYSTPRLATPDCEPVAQERISSAIDAIFPGLDTAVEQWTTAHADFNWSNVTGSKLVILDWEDFGSAPRGLDAANLWFSSLRYPILTEKVRDHRRVDLESRTGKIMALWKCSEFLSWAGEEEPVYGVAKRESERLTQELAGT